MSKDFRECPDGVAFENNHVNQLILSWIGKGGQGVPLRQLEVSDPTLYAGDFRNKGTGGKHLRATHSSGSPVLLDVTDAGVLLSVSGGAATNSLIYPKTVIGWTGLASTIPSGYTVLAASKGAFPFGASVDGDLGATGGASTYNLSHSHTGPSHAHGGITGNGGDANTGSTGGTTFSAGGTTGSAGAGATSTGGPLGTNGAGAGSTGSGGTGSTGGSGSLTAEQSGNTRTVDNADAVQIQVSDDQHTHSINSHTHLGPSHTHSTSDHTHSINSHAHSISDHTHSSPLHSHTESNHTHTTAVHNHGLTLDGTGATGLAGSAVQSTLPPYWRMYFLERS